MYDQNYMEAKLGIGEGYKDFVPMFWISVFDKMFV